jgi:hypothetical protein
MRQLLRRRRIRSGLIGKRSRRNPPATRRAPGIAVHAAGVAFQIKSSAQNAARVAAAKAAAEREIADAEAQIDWAMTPSDSAARSTAVRAAFSHDSLLVPMSSMTL